MTSIPLPQGTTAEAREETMPRGIPYIISNEFAERFCFYGINSILTVYFTQHLHFPEAKASSWQSLFKAAAYFFPLLGAVIADVFWGKTRTILTFSVLYAFGCVALALFGDTTTAVVASLFLVALGTGGIKPCVSTNVGDQFTAKNQHLIERAFSWFYLAINAGSLLSIGLCPVLLSRPEYGPRWAFGLPAVMMLVATVVFWVGRKKFATVPPAGKLADFVSKDGLKLILSVGIIYVFTGFFWMLWEHANGNSFTLQASSPLMDKDLGFGITLLPAQLQSVNGLFILALTPLFSYVVYPFWGRFFTVTPLRKIGIGMFTAAASFLIIASIERRIMHGQSVSAWWQIFAYVVLTCAEVLVSITALEFSYKQAPPKMKSFVMALFYFSITLGNTMIAVVNSALEKPLHVTAIEVGRETWVRAEEAKDFVVGQKIDFPDDVGIRMSTADGETTALRGTFVVAEIDGGRLRLIDVVGRKAVVSSGTFSQTGKVSTYRLVGPDYYYFFIGVMLVAVVAFIFVALAYKEKTYVRQENEATPG